MTEFNGYFTNMCYFNQVLKIPLRFSLRGIKIINYVYIKNPYYYAFLRIAAYSFA